MIAFILSAESRNCGGISKKNKFIVRMGAKSDHISQQEYTYNLMNWNGSRSTIDQISIEFPTLDGAIKFCDTKGMAYKVLESKSRTITPKSYTSNFK